MNNQHMIDVFVEYQNKFGEWLYTAWDFSMVKWDELTKMAEESIKNNTPLTEEQKQQCYEQFNSDVVY